MANRNMPRGRAAVSAGASVTVAVILVVLVAVSYYAFQPPSPVPADAPPTQFSAVRAMVHGRAIASQVHPAWSDAAAQARDYIVSYLRS
ncbi:MAG TPA: peptidase M28, partial [Blastocatellia bacterium]